MKHMSTWDLLDLADDYNNVASEFLLSGNMNKGRYLSAIEKLHEINTELLSRMPEGEFVILVFGPLPIRKRDNDSEWVTVGHWYQPIGFEPECYARLTEAQAELAELDRYEQSPEWYQASH